jgi:hypothetical protein
MVLAFMATAAADTASTFGGGRVGVCNIVAYSERVGSDITVQICR